MKKLMFLFAIALCSVLSMSAENLPENLKEAESKNPTPEVAAVQSFNDCWTSTTWSKSHTFPTGACSWISVSAAHGSTSSKVLEIYELDSNGDEISVMSVSIPANTTETFTISSPDPGTRKVKVKVYSSGIDICIATL